MGINDIQVNTVPLGVTAATGGLSRGEVIGIDASGNAAIAQTDATAVVALGVCADDYDAGDYVSIYREDSIGYILTKTTDAKLSEVTCGVAADGGESIAATGAGNHKIVAILLATGVAGELTRCLIRYYDKYLAA